MTKSNPDEHGSAAATDLVRELRTFANGIEHYLVEMSHLHTMHRTDLSALALVMDSDGMAPKDISESLGLSPPATSAMLDRLERAGHVRRERVLADRRSVSVEVTDSALDVGRSMFGVLARHMNEVLDTHDESDLATAAALMAEVNAAVLAASAEARGTQKPV